VNHGTYQTERLLNLNSYAIAEGFTSKEPYDKVSCPTVCPHEVKESMGFQYKLHDPTAVPNSNAAYTASTEYDSGDNGDSNEDGGDDIDQLPSSFIDDPEFQMLLRDSWL
jgi:hypothetical protein